MPPGPWCMRCTRPIADRADGKSMGLSKPPLARVVEFMINEIPRDEEKPGWKPISGHSSAFTRRA